MGLCLHAGAIHKSRAQIAELPLAAPMGNRHVIRPFIDDIVLVDTLLSRQGLVINDEAYGVSFIDGKPAKFFGVMEMASKNTEFALTVGLRGSYDQTLPRGLAVGSRVFVCDNLAFSSDITLHTRQTTFIGERLPEMLRQAVEKIPGLAEHQEQQFDRYKSIRFDHSKGDAILMQCFRREVLNNNQFAKAVELWDKFDYGTAWDLYNVVTAAIKPPPDKPHVLNAWTRSIGLTEVMKETFA
jgi:hypothetical protein